MKTATKHTHTIGPWSVETKGSRHFIDGADELSVAYVDRAGVRERQTYEANARLIASAPALLEALILAVPLMQRYAMRSPVLEPSVDRILPAMISAIDKAEGNA